MAFPIIETKAAHHAISALFPSPLTVLPSSGTAKVPLVLQYEVKLQKGLECGGAYVKLLTETGSDESGMASGGEKGGLREGGEYTDKTPFTIMFGPVSLG